MSEETFHLLTEAVRGNPENGMDVNQFAKENMSFIFENSCKTRPKFTFDESKSTLYRVQRGQMKEVLYESKAREIVQHIHRPPGRACRKASVRAVVEEFQSKYFCKGIDQIARETLRNCNGTCKRLQALKTRNPPPKLIRTYSIMERVQIDLLEMYGPKSPFKDTAKHGYRLILTVVDCFSKYCWLIPLSNKKADTVAGALQHLFVEYGCPEMLHSDNGGEFIAEVIQQLCKLMNISPIHGAPRHPQSQGQVESLNKKVKSALRHRLLDFKPETMADVWPFLLPEISQVINNTWHATIKCTPFEVFFGRPSRQFVGNTGSYIAVAPSDKYLLLMASTGQKTGIESAPSGKDDSSSDSCSGWSTDDNSADSDQEDSQMSPKHDMNSEELISSLHQTSQARLQIYLNVRENTEARYYQNYLAYIRKIRPQKFGVGDRVMFRFPEQYGLVVLPNIEGIVSEVMSSDYYRVSYTMMDGSKGSTVLYSSLMVGTAIHSPQQPQIPEDSSDLQESDLLTKINVFAISSRESLRNDCVQLPQDLDPTSLLDEVIQQIGVEHSDLNSPSALLDFFCYSLDLNFLSITALDQEYSSKCKQYGQVCQHFLTQKRFQYYLSGIHAWESSRCLNPVHLQMALSKSAMPYFIGSSHNCVECIHAMKPCQHPCCVEWYIKAGVKCGILEKSGSGYQCSNTLNTTISTTKLLTSHLSSKQNSSPSSVSQIFTGDILKSSLPKKRKSCATKTRKSKKICRSQSKQNAKANKGIPEQKSKSKAPCRSQKQSHKLNAYPPNLRSIAGFKPANLYQRKSISALPMTLSKRRLSAILSELAVEFEASNELQVFKDKCISCLEEWTELSSQEKNNFSANLRYAASIVGVHETKYAQELQSVTSPKEPYLQLQGDSNLCGLCVLNNLHQSERFTIYSLNQIADGVWLSHWTDLDMNPAQSVQAMRSQLGDYSIDVLDAAVNSYGNRLINITSAVRDFITVHADGEYLLSNPKLFQQHLLKQIVLPAALLLKQQSYHYICILFDIEGSVWWLDSRGSQPLILPAIRLYAVMRKEFKSSTSAAALYVFTTEMGSSVQEDPAVMSSSDVVAGDYSSTSINGSYSLDQDFCEVKVATGGDSSTKQESIISSNDIIDLTCDSGENADTHIDHKPQPRIALTLCGSYCYDCHITRIFRNEWIDSEVISFYMKLLQAESDLAVHEARSRRRLVLLPTYFYVKWTSFLREKEKSKTTTGRVRYKKGKQTVLNHPCNWIEEEDPDNISAILAPVNIAQSHWILCVMDFQEQCITCYDSLGYASHQSVCDNLRLMIPELYKQKTGVSCNVWDWSIKNAMNFPQQTNSSDCGIFVCKIAECIVKKKKFSFKPDSQSMRYWLLNQLLSSPEKLSTVKADETVALELVHEAEISWGVEIDITPDPFHYTDDDSSEEEKAETPQTFDIDEYDILEPAYHYQKEEIKQCQELFLTFRRRRQKLLKQHVIDTYKTIPVKHIESQLPGGLTLQSVRHILTGMEEMLRQLCYNPKSIQWMQHISQHLRGGAPVTHQLVKDVASLWPLNIPGVRDEVEFFIVAISEDVSPLSQDHLKMMRRAQFELIPEAMIHILQVLYKISYEEAAGSFITKTLPVIAATTD